MTKHILKYEIVRTDEDGLHVIASFTASPKSDIMFNKFINLHDHFLNFDYIIHNDFDILMTLDDMEIPRKYHDSSITVEALYTILSTEQKEGDTNVNS